MSGQVPLTTKKQEHLQARIQGNVLDWLWKANISGFAYCCVLHLPNLEESHMFNSADKDLDLKAPNLGSEDLGKDILKVEFNFFLIPLCKTQIYL